MNNNEAVEILQNIDKVYRQFTEKEIEALNMAISALEKQTNTTECEHCEYNYDCEHCFFWELKRVCTKAEYEKLT